ncbi:MAG: hypothetical protein CLLPBCKN_004367 [Chroococcidiopsis cubana SAG 39.79]|nr:hypothetical protein [Chroococcidiopsis cubana SAG 39.79]
MLRFFINNTQVERSHMSIEKSLPNFISRQNRRSTTSENFIRVSPNQTLIGG